MGEYIRSKKAYTRWEAEEENVDIEYRPERPPGLPEEGCTSGPKGKIIKFLVVMVALVLGLVIGMLVRRSWVTCDKTSTATPDSTCCSHCTASTTVTAVGYQQSVLLQLQSSIHAANIRKHLRQVSQETHVAGTEGGHRLARLIRDRWKSAGLHNAHLEPDTVLLSRPSSDRPNNVQVSDANGTRVFVASEVGDDLLHPDLRPYSAFSSNGSAEGHLVYANYGRREDFEKLKAMPIDVSNTIVIMRVGKIHCANKVKNAELYGAKAALLYPDPSDFEAGPGSTLYPQGLGLPGDAVVRGSLKLNVADEASQSTPTIPAQPLSYNDAKVLLTGLDGPVAPPSWQGALGLVVHLGPGYVAPNNSHTVRINVFNVQEPRDIYHVSASIRGVVEPTRYVMVGCHHDAWSNGSGDPGTGLAVLTEVAVAFASLYATGWRPARSLLFFSWDAGEYNSLGSAHWARRHASELASRAVAYVNLDQAVSGNRSLWIGASPLLRKAIVEATEATPSSLPQGPEQSMYQFWVQSDPEVPDDPMAGPILHGLGGGSDYVNFQSYLGISSAHLAFIGQKKRDLYPLSHTAYDNFDAVANHVDPTFLVSKTLADVVAALLLKLTDSSRLPFNARDYGTTVGQAFDTFMNQSRNELHTHNISIAHFQKAVMRLGLAANTFHELYNSSNPDITLLANHAYNDQFLEMERALVETVDRQTNQHAIIGPSPDNLSSSQYFPGIARALRQCETVLPGPVCEQELRIQIDAVVRALDGASGVIETSLVTPSGMLGQDAS